MRVCHTSRFQQVASMQCFSGAMAKPFVVERTATDNATFQFCSRVRPISRFPLGFTQCFSAMMAVCYLVEAPMTSYDQQHRIPPLEDGVAYTQVAATPCCCAVTALRWHVVAITTDSATPHPCSHRSNFTGSSCSRGLEYGHDVMTCFGLDGLEVLSLGRLAAETDTDLAHLRVVLPDGRLMNAVCSSEPTTTPESLLNAE